MVLNLSHPEKNSNKFGVIQFDFSRKVDFLISLLAKTDIRFSPFDYHVPQVTSYLITLDEWRSWLNQTLAKDDPRWYWRVDDIVSEAQKEVDDCRQMFSPELIENDDCRQMFSPELIENLDWSAIREIYVKRITWFDQQYRQVAQEYSTPLQDGIEEEWMQDTRIIEAWEVYQSTLKRNPNIHELLHTPTNYPSGEIDSIYKVYFVNYPEVVKCSIGINTIIGIPKEAGFNIQSVIDEIERLVRE
ncbi:MULTISPECIES: hypothetical protein [unclassified Nostoc]|uniref:hypothetical protein n=1 Tax=unclassified Nostoc TaxID=2593658 RepID=UPI002AD1ED3A|nr:MULTISPECIES: hypothetical protein [unclassified Nostoc]MDZ8126651.1 hypothetical protein [Nostoc sp. CmiVER01]MDZ8227875.1 hypothetical protein [Nostoc sp. ChiVER01]